MVTLQILVLSFLVRIQVAQLKRSSSEGRFFLFYVRVGWSRHYVPLMSNLPMHQCKHCARLLLHHSKAAHQPTHPSSHKFLCRAP